MQHDSTVSVMPAQEIRLKPYDKITVVVNSKDQKLADLFNLALVAQEAVSGSGVAAQPRQSVLRYTVDRDGNIDFPVMGVLYVGGLTRDSVAKFIKQQLVSRQLLTDAVVNVECENLYVSVLGEVRNPGRYNITRDCFTIIDAISMAGDLTMNGERRRVLVIRNKGDRQLAYRLNLCSGEDIYTSPAILSATERCRVCGTTTGPHA